MDNSKYLLTRRTCPKCGREGYSGSIGTHIKRCGMLGLDADRFWTRMERLPWSGCWIWTGCTYNCEYGSVAWHFEPQGKATMIAAHRAAWMLVNGPIPADMDVCHTCDVRLCCNPAHLFLGTAKENMADMYAKGRDRSRGEKNKHARLTAEQVLEIRRLYKKTSPLRGNGAELASRFGVSRGAILGVAQGRTWKHLP